MEIDQELTRISGCLATGIKSPTVYDLMIREILVEKADRLLDLKLERLQPNPVINFDVN